MELTISVIGGVRDPEELTRSLAFDLAVDESAALTSLERLAIVQGAGLVHLVSSQLWANMLVSAGCYAEAETEFEVLKHWRKLGDLAWARGALDQARTLYMRPADSNRNGPDWDRLIKLAYVRADWQGLLHAFLESDCVPLRGSDRIVLCRTECALRPYAQMVAQALVEADKVEELPIARDTREKLGLSEVEWRSLLESRRLPDHSTRARLLRNAIPRKTSGQSRTFRAAIDAGSTPRAARVAAAITSVTHAAESAKNALITYCASGVQGLLDAFLDELTAFEVPNLCQTFLFHTLERNLGPVLESPPSFRIRLFGSHPLMNKRHFGRLLNARFESGADIQPSDLVTGLFQSLWLPSLTSQDRKRDERFDLDKLSASIVWAEAKLQDWLTSDGRANAELVRAAWATKRNREDEVRDLPQWRTLVRAAQEHLGDRWAKELAHEHWLQEAKVFQLLTRSLRGFKVVRHAQPVWLAPQHFDCYVEEARLAVEYMGEQHYAPIEVFGGEEGFRRTLERDERKRLVAARAGVRLENIRYDAELASRIAEIVALVKASAR